MWLAFAIVTIAAMLITGEGWPIVIMAIPALLVLLLLLIDNNSNDDDDEM